MDYKQVVIVRTDLGMSRGKLAVQVAHASVIAAFRAYHERREWFDKWWGSGQKKIVVKGRSEEEVLERASRAEKMGLPVSIVRDAGLTELPPGTLTAVGIGPAPSEEIDKVTGDLKLL